MSKKNLKVFISPYKFHNVLEVLSGHFDNQSCMRFFNPADITQEKFVLAPKRGNYSYERKLTFKFYDMSKKMSKLMKINKKKGLTNSAMITLTFKQKDVTQFQAWEKARIDLSEYMQSLKKALRRWGNKIKYALAVFEAHATGYPHLHIITIFENPIKYRIGKSKHTGKSRGYVLSGQLYNLLKYHTTVTDEEELKKLQDEGLAWNRGNVDAEAIYNVKKAKNYVMKYLVKGLQGFQDTFDKVKEQVKKGKKVYKSDLKKVLFLYYLLSIKHMKGYRLYGSRDLIYRPKGDIENLDKESQAENQDFEDLWVLEMQERWSDKFGYTIRPRFYSISELYQKTKSKVMNYLTRMSSGFSHYMDDEGRMQVEVFS